MLYSSRSFRHNASMRAVFPDPTGLFCICIYSQSTMDHPRGKFDLKGWLYPPIPIVNARSFQSRPSINGNSRFKYEPGPSRISCEWPCPPNGSSWEWVWPSSLPWEWECVCDILWEIKMRKEVHSCRMDASFALLDMRSGGRLTAGLNSQVSYRGARAERI